MSRRVILSSLAVMLASVAIGFALYAKSATAATPGVIALAGDVRVDENVVRAPAITYPTPDYTVGIPTPASAAPKKRAAGAPASTSRLPVVSGFLAEALVAQGDHVAKGQPVALLDTAMLDLGVRQAETARAKARATVAVLDNNLDTMASARSTLVTARAKLVAARASLVTARASLVTAIGVLTKKRAALVAQISTIEQLIVRFPPAGPPNVPPYPVLLAGLRQGLTGLDAGITGAKAGLVKMSAGLATMSTGLAKMSSGLAKLDTARKQLQGVRKLAVVNVGAQDVAVELAKARRNAATVTSPVDGVVTYVRPAGTAVMVGAPLVRIRPDGPAYVYTYLTPDQLVQIAIGSAASISFDSSAGRILAGRVSHVDDVSALPPTSFPTSIVHMTRAVRVTIRLDDGLTAPPGTPVDVEIGIGS